MKIGVFDSGIGGITVLKELRNKFPEQDYLYFGDTANVPYGTKSATQIKALCRAAASYLKSEGMDLLVVACNTASCVAIDEIRKTVGSIPVIGVVEAGVDTAVEAIRQDDRMNSVLVLGTRATVRSHVYASLIQAVLGPSITVREQECPLLVPMIEEGWTDHPILHETVRQYITPYLSLPPGIALLACTHYPWIREAFARALPGWQIVDSASAVSRALQGSLSASQGLGGGTVKWRFSDPEAAPHFVFERESVPRPPEGTA